MQPKLPAGSSEEGTKKRDVLQELWYAQKSLKYDLAALLRCLENSKVLCKREFDSMRLEVRLNGRRPSHEPAEHVASEEASGMPSFTFQSSELELQKLREKARLRESGVAELIQVPHVDPRGFAVPDGMMAAHAPEATTSSTDGPKHVNAGGPDGAGVPDSVEMSFADKLRGSLLKLPDAVQVTHAAEATNSSTEDPKRVSSGVTDGVEATRAPEATKFSADDPKRSTPCPLRSGRSPQPKDDAHNQPEGDAGGGERQHKNLTMQDGVKQLLNVMWLPDGSRQCTCAVAGGKLFVLQNPQPGQGPLRAQVFDPSTGKWPSVGRFNTPRMNAAAAATGTHLYLVGGQGVVEKSVLKTAVRLDVQNLNANGRWEELPCKMSARRQSAAAASFGDGRVLVCGGSSQREEVRESAPVLDSVEVLRLSARQLEWQPWPPMLGPRARHAAATVGQSILTCGGGTADCEALATCELCDPETQTWSRLQPMCIAREAPLAITLAGELFVFSGRAREVDEPEADAERFDLEGGVWEVLPLDQIGI